MGKAHEFLLGKGIKSNKDNISAFLMEQWLEEFLKMSEKETINSPELHTLLPTFLDDKTYIEDLEGLVCFLAKTYEKLKDTYWLNHLKTCGVDNPKRRDLTECEKSELNRFSLIQGSRLQKRVKQLANIKGIG